LAIIKSMDKGLEVSWATLWRIVGMLVLVSILYIALDIWIAVLLSIVISSALDASVTWLEKRRVPRVIGTLGIFIFVILAFALILYTVVPIALTELSVLLRSIGDIENPAFSVPEAEKFINLVNESISQLTNVLLSGGISFIDIVSNFIGGLALAISVFVLSFYLTVDRGGVEKFIREVMPPGYEDKILEIYFRTRYKIGQWLYGQIFLSLSVGVASFMGLWFIGVKYSLILGILAGIFEIVPFVGPILAGALAFLIAISDSFSAGIYVFLLFLLIQQIESVLLTPVFMRLTTNLHPAVVLISLLIGGKLLGFVGIIIAVPAAVMLQELADSWSNEKIKRRASSLNFQA
jgi:predicted PurR-regulated permease PerM